MMSNDRANGETNPSDSMRGSLFRDLTGGFPLGPAAVIMPHSQAGHMKATDQTRPDKMPLPRGRPHMNHTAAENGNLYCPQTLGPSLSQRSIDHQPPSICRVIQKGFI